MLPQVVSVVVVFFVVSLSVFLHGFPAPAYLRAQWKRWEQDPTPRRSNAPRPPRFEVRSLWQSSRRGLRMEAREGRKGGKGSLAEFCFGL